MDVTDKVSILEGVKLIEEKEGKLHILVNKYYASYSIPVVSDNAFNQLRPDWPSVSFSQ